MLGLKMDLLSGVLKVWDNGVETPFDPFRSDFVEYNDLIRRRTGAKYGVATKWTFSGAVYVDERLPIPIPDMSGLVYATAGWKQWVVLHPDGRVKAIIDVPKVTEQSVPALGNLGDPIHAKGAPLHIMYGEGSDGDRDGFRFTFDMHTCKLLKADFVGRHW